VATYTGQQKNIRAPSGIRTHDSCVLAENTVGALDGAVTVISTTNISNNNDKNNLFDVYKIIRR
jgi:hypothetical protein